MLCSESVVAGGLTWAYRRSDALGEATNKAPILMLHGLGSSSYSWRELMRLCAEEGHTCYAPDWIGSGHSEKPANWGYDEASYIAAMNDFVDAVGLKGKPYFVVTHGFVLGQYGMLWAIQNRADIERLVIMNVPLGPKSKLRPELAAYKNPISFMRPKQDAKFAADLYNASGLAFVIQYTDAQVYDLPYQEGSDANIALSKTMEKCDYKALLDRVDEAFCGWKTPTAILYGNSDPFLDVRDAMYFLETKRTTTQLMSVEGKLGHMPQEDYADNFAPTMLKYFDGEDITVSGQNKFKKAIDPNADGSVGGGS